MKKNVVLCAVLVFGISLLFSYAALAQEEPGEDLWCARTQGFWKNHPEAWPVEGLWVGEVWYSKAELLDKLNTPVRGSLGVILWKQFIAASLNVIANSSLNYYSVYGEYVLYILSAAEAYLVDLAAGVADEMDAEPLKDKLDTFNNSEACYGEEGGGGEIPV